MVPSAKKVMRKIAIALMFMVAMPLSAQEPERETKKPMVIESEKTSVTRHSVKIGNQTVNYTATAGTLHLAGEEDQDAASIFYVSYTREGVENLDEMHYFEAGHMMYINPEALVKLKEDLAGFIAKLNQSRAYLEM
ncbi:MAG: carboxypeptidase C (cathepsin A) [Rhodothermales bacterium]